MGCERFVTLEEMIASPYECAIASCCDLTGEAREVFIDSLIEEAQIMAESYLERDICKKVRKDVFVGDDSTSFFLRNLPLDINEEITLEKRLNRNYYGAYSELETLSPNYFYVDDQESGMIRNLNGFRRDHTYTITYTAGWDYLDIPKPIKTAIMMLVVNLSQRLDNMNLSSVDFGVGSVKVDKASSFTFGQSNMIKQVVIKSVKDINDLPIPVMKILDRYKYNSSL